MTGRKANEDIWSDRTGKVIGNGKVDISLTHSESLSEILNFVTFCKTSQNVKAGGTM